LLLSTWQPNSLAAASDRHWRFFAWFNDEIHPYFALSNLLRKFPSTTGFGGFERPRSSESESRERSGSRRGFVSAFRRNVAAEAFRRAAVRTGTVPRAAAGSGFHGLSSLADAGAIRGSLWRERERFDEGNSLARIAGFHGRQRSPQPDLGDLQ